VPAENLIKRFGPESFDVVIATELLEHVIDWRRVINNMKTVLISVYKLIASTSDSDIIAEKESFM